MEDRLSVLYVFTQFRVYLYTFNYLMTSAYNFDNYEICDFLKQSFQKTPE